MTVKELYLEILSQLKAAGIEAYESEARFLACEVLNMTSTELLLNYSSSVDLSAQTKAMQLCGRRISGEPLQYILGSWDFMGRRFFVGRGVLIPRPETELLCMEAINEIGGGNASTVYDLCSGSGCIGLTIKCECPKSDVYLIEKSETAFSYLLKNAQSLGIINDVKAVNGDVLKAELFDLLPDADIIISNPPYIRSDEISTLQKEVTFEPEMALDGGADGLIFYRYIIKNWSEKLTEKGKFLFEIGEDQGDDVLNILQENGFKGRIIKDYNNHDRIVIGGKLNDI